MENGYIESFNGKFRDECLNENWFFDLADARRKIAEWKTDYNHVRPALGAGIQNPDGVSCGMEGGLLHCWTGARGLKRRPLAPDPHPRYAAGRTKTGESLIIPGLKTGGRSKEPTRTMVFVAVFTGLRVGELLGLKWSDIDLQKMVVHVVRSIVMQHVGDCKTEASRKPVPLDLRLAKVLWDWRLQSPYPNRRGLGFC